MHLQVKAAVVDLGASHLDHYTALSTALGKFLNIEWRSHEVCERSEQYFVERVTGIEPVSSGWKPEVIATIRHPRRGLGLGYG